MQYALTEEQRLILESAEKFAHEKLDFETRRKRAAEGKAVDRELWAQLAEMGWLGVGIGEDQGGFGGTAVETALIAEALGRGQLLDPYVMCGVFPLRILAGDASRGRLLQDAISGETLLAVAHSEPKARACLSEVRATAKRRGDRWILNGRKTLVAGARECDAMIVSARNDGGTRDVAGVTLFLVDPRTDGVAVEGEVLTDWSTGADMVLTEAEVSADAVIGTSGAGLELLRSAAEEAIVALCAEAVGALDGAIRTTATYIAERKQFGVPLSSFQVLQHRVSDMSIELVIARSAVIRGLAALATAEPEERSAQVSGCKAMVTANLKWATAQGIQLHGGNGITEEYAVGHYFKRLLVIDAFFGRRAHHLARYTDWMRGRGA